MATGGRSICRHFRKPGREAGEGSKPPEEGRVTDPADLPPNVLDEVLVLLTPQQRLGVCTLVSRRWEKAAGASVDSIKLHDAYAAQLSGLPKWLAKHGHHVTQLHISGPQEGLKALGAHPAPRLRQLSCGLLHDLQLERCTLQLAPACTHHPGALHGLVGLTRLCLGHGNTYLYAGHGRSLKCLRGLTALQHLQIQGHGQQEAALDFPAGVVSRLVRLTHLELGRFVVPDAALEQLSHVSGLRHLSLGCGGGEVAGGALAAIAGLPHLTLLQLWEPELNISPYTTPGISGLTALQHLALTDAWCSNPSVLSTLVQLRSLVLRGCIVQDTLDGPAAVSGLLAAVSSMQHLTELDLHCSLKQQAAEVAHYSALTASSNLQKLDLGGCAVPRDAWPAMFGSLRGTVPQLTSLDFNAVEPEPAASDMERIAVWCPALGRLAARGVQQTRDHLTQLSQLAQLTSLTIDHFYNTAADGLVHLTGLVELWIGVPNNVSIWGLQPFIQLQQLTVLGIADGDAAGSDAKLDAEEPENWTMKFLLKNEAPDGYAPDVWEQVVEVMEAAADSDDPEAQDF